MAPNRNANDYVESGFAKGNMGKEHQKCQTFPKQPNFVRIVERSQQAMADVERRSRTSASHLSGSEINQHIVNLLPLVYRIGVKDEILRPQIIKISNSNLIRSIIGKDSLLLVFGK